MWTPYVPFQSTCCSLINQRQPAGKLEVRSAALNAPSDRSMVPGHAAELPSLVHLAAPNAHQVCRVGSRGGEAACTSERVGGAASRPVMQDYVAC